MNRNGFVFVETIVVTVVLTVALIVIYSTFSNVLNNEKKRMAYEDTSYMYNTFYLQQFLRTLNIKNYIDYYFESNDVVIKQLSCNDVLLYKSDDDINSKGIFCERLIHNSSLLGIKKVYITKYNIEDIKECILNNCNDNHIKSNIEDLDISFINYLKTLKPNSELEDYYRLIVEYEEEDLDYDNYINICGNGYNYNGDVCVDDNGSIKEPYCPLDYRIASNSCIRVINKHYFDNIIINKN